MSCIICRVKEFFKYRQGKNIQRTLIDLSKRDGTAFFPCVWSEFGAKIYAVIELHKLEVISSKLQENGNFGSLIGPMEKQSVANL